MGWEHGYYIRKVRDGATVRSVYVGAGLRGLRAAAEDAQAQAARALLTEHRRRQRAERKAVDDAYQVLRALVHAELRAAGYHQSNRQWRRQR